MSEALLSVRDLSVSYPLRRAGWSLRTTRLDALTNVTLDVEAGGRLGVVGESGSGKSTLARAILGFVTPDSGVVLWQGEPIDRRNPERMSAVRRELQVVFQDPFGSLDPRMTAGESVAEALDALAGITERGAVLARLNDAFHEVGLDASFARRYPHELSGGQCQRVAIARATVVRPRLLICDEAVSALDVSVQAQIVNLLMDLSVRHHMALLFISHNLAVVRHLCDRVAVLCKGRLVEYGPRDAIFTRPSDPYTRALLAAVPDPTPRAGRALRPN